MKYIAIRKELNNVLYLDKNFFERFKDADLEKYKFTKVKIDDEYFDDLQVTDFDDDLTFNVEKYNARKELEVESQYENLIVEKIRKKYSINQELAILRQRDTKPDEFADYNTFVENVKAEVKKILYGGADDDDAD